MSRKKEPRPTPSKHITSTLERLGSKYSVHKVWQDWMEGLALAFANSIGTSFPTLQNEDWEAREKRYLLLCRNYEPKEWNEIACLTGALVLVLEENPEQDILSQLYMSLEIGNEYIGQFHTPWPVCSMMSMLLLDRLEETIEERGYFTVSDPCCGAGTMLVACAQAAMSKDINPQKQMWFHGQDIAITSVHMTYNNLSLRGLPGQVVHGDTLRMQVNSVWSTPAHILGGWARRMKLRS